MLWSISLLSFVPAILACPYHSQSSRSAVSRATAKDWNYTDPSSWGSIRPEYAACSSGTMQSPVNLPATNFSTTHNLTFNYPNTVAGELTNWGFGPNFALNQTNGNDFSGNPSFTAGNTTHYLISWHTHTPSDHEISGASYPAEMHLVHGTSNGTISAVLGIPITFTSTPQTISSDPSPFFEQFLSSTPNTTSDSAVKMHGVDMNVALNEAGDLKEYWTYMGSLTTPACTEGVRWWVSGSPLSLTEGQMVNLKSVSAFSSRGIQGIIAQDLGL